MAATNKSTTQATTDLVVVQLDTARAALAQAKTIQQTKKILDVAAAAEIYAKRQQLGQDAIDYAHSIKIEALRQLGELLREAPKNIGTRGQLISRGVIGGSREGPPIDAPTLAEQGVTKKPRISRLTCPLARSNVAAC